MTFVMYDSTEDNLPADALCIAGYVGGSWPTATLGWFAEHRAKHKLTIAISADERARCLDVERGDATIEQAPAWYRDKAERQWGLPVLYTSASVAADLIRVLRDSGIPRKDYYLWSAHYGHGQHICGPTTCGYPAADGTQWTDLALGRKLDESLMSSRVFPPARRPRPLPPAPKRKRVQRVRHVLKIHPKVVGASTGAALSAGILAFLNALGVHVTPVEMSAIATVGAAVLGYVSPQAKAQST